MGAQRLLLRVGSVVQIRYLVLELRYLMFGKGAEKAQMIEEVIWKGYVHIHAETTRPVTSFAGEPLVI